MCRGPRRVRPALAVQQELPQLATSGRDGVVVSEPIGRQIRVGTVDHCVDGLVRPVQHEDLVMAEIVVQPDAEIDVEPTRRSKRVFGVPDRIVPDRDALLIVRRSWRPARRGRARRAGLPLPGDAVALARRHNEDAGDEQRRRGDHAATIGSEDTRGETPLLQTDLGRAYATRRSYLPLIGAREYCEGYYK